MNKTERMLAIVLKLQTSGGNMRAEDLAAYFETSKRTIYRDITALSEAGVPIKAIPGQGYGLLEGYFLPPLSFSTDEAIMLLLGGRYIAQNFDARYQLGASSACLKIESVLPEPIRQEVNQLQSSIHLVAPAIEPSNLLKEVRRAVIETHTVRFQYYSPRSAEQPSTPTERDANPYGLVYYDGNWYMVAYCLERRAVRNFRLDRMEKLRLLSQTFTRPSDFQLQQRQATQQRSLTVRVLFDQTVARRVKESRYFYIVAQENCPEGLLVTLLVRQEQDVLGWLLSWGRHVQVLEPESLRQNIQEEAKAILENSAKSSLLLT